MGTPDPRPSGRAAALRRRAEQGGLALLAALAFAAPARSQAQSFSETVLAALDRMQQARPRTVSSRIRLSDREVVQTWRVLDARRFGFAQTPSGSMPEVIVWDDSAYLRTPAGWYRKSLNATPIPLNATDWMRRALDNTVSNVQRLPDDTADGRTLQHYGADVDYRDGIGAYAGHFEVRLDAETQRPVDSSFEGSYAGQRIRIDMQADYSSTPALEPPTPVLNPP